MSKISDLVRSLGATSIKAIGDITASNLSLVIAEERKSRRASDIAKEFVIAGATTKSAPTIVSDLRALGEYLLSYPESMDKLNSANGKEWRNLLCAARRGQRLKGGGIHGEAVTQVLVQFGGINSRQVRTALNVLSEHKEDLENAENQMRGEVLENPPEEVVIPLDVVPEETATAEELPVTPCEETPLAEDIPAEVVEVITEDTPAVDAAPVAKPKRKGRK